MNAPGFRTNNFDLIRLLAALQVLLTHGLYYLGLNLPGPLGAALSALPGVPIFFVLSGFLVSASWENSRALSVYGKNRFLRIYPALWACLAVSIAVVFALADPVFTAGELALWLLSQVSFGQSYSPAFLRPYGVGMLNGSLWTIPLEVQFYVLLPGMYWAFDRVRWRRWVVATILGALVVLHQVFLHMGHESFARRLLAVSVAPYLDMFMFGVLLQRSPAFVERFLKGKLLPVAAGYGAVAGIAWRFGFSYAGNEINPLLAGCLALLAVAAAYSRPGISASLLGDRDLSYGIYIYHMVWINALLMLGIAGWQNLCLTLALTLVTAAMSWRFVERPALSLKQRTLRGAAAARNPLKPAPLGRASSTT